MKLVYDNKAKKYHLEVSILDKCFSCGYYSRDGEDCPLLQEIDNQNLLLRRDSFIKENCKMYFYMIPKEIENKVQGFYLGDEGDRGYTDKFKYR